MTAKVGDTIRWSFSDEHPKFLAGKIFEAEVLFVNNEDQCYGVHADYGQDYIPFDKAEVLTKLERM